MKGTQQLVLKENCARVVLNAQFVLPTPMQQVSNFFFLFLFQQFLFKASGEGRTRFDSCNSRSRVKLQSTYVRCKLRGRELEGQTAHRFQNTHLLGGQAAAKPSTTWLHLSDKQAADLLKAESFCLYLLPFFPSLLPRLF